MRASMPPHPAWGDPFAFAGRGSSAPAALHFLFARRRCGLAAVQSDQQYQCAPAPWPRCGPFFLRPEGQRESRLWRGRIDRSDQLHGFGREGRFKGEGFHYQLIAAIGVDSGGGSDHIANHFQLFGEGGSMMRFAFSQRSVWSTRTDSDNRFMVPWGRRVCFTTRLV